MSFSELHSFMDMFMSGIVVDGGMNLESLLILWEVCVDQLLVVVVLFFSVISF